MKRISVILSLLFISLGLHGACAAGENSKPKFQPESFLHITHRIDIGICVGDICKKAKSIIGVGSGFVLLRTAADTYGVTAGHVCTAPDFSGHFKDGGVKQNSTITATTNSGKRYPLSVVAIGKDVDVCVVKISGVRLKPLPLSGRPPVYGKKYYTMASPMNIFRPGMVPIFEGYYSGRVKSIPRPDSAGSMEADIYTIPAQRGSSGAAIFDSRGQVVGITSMALANFENYQVSPSYKKFRKFLIEFSRGVR